MRSLIARPLRSVLAITVVISLFLASLLIFQASQVQAQVSGTIGFIDTTEVRIIDSSFATTWADYAVVSGWTASTNYPGEVMQVLVTTGPDYNPSNIVGKVTPHMIRDDVNNAYDLGSDVRSGFDWTVPSKFHDGAEHTFYFWSGFQLAETPPASALTNIGSSYMRPMDGGIHGSLDVIDGMRIAGWAVDYDTSPSENPSMAIVAFVNGMHAGAGVANLARPDVQNAIGGWTDRVGYNFHITWPSAHDMPEIGDSAVLELYAVSPTEKKLELFVSTTFTFQQ